MEPIKINYRNRLPHIAPIGATFFITFRLADSLPISLVKELKEAMDLEIQRLKKEKPKDYEIRIMGQRKKFFKQYDHQLDKEPLGACYLKNKEIAKLVKQKLHDLDGKKYVLQAYTIMSNHVHILIDTSIQIKNESSILMPLSQSTYMQLFQIMKLIKGSTARAANLYLNRKGKFWQKDSYDRYIRNETEFWRVLNYILENPVKAGIAEKTVEYPHNYYNSLLDQLRPLQ